MFENSKRLSILRAIAFVMLGCVSGMQIALYMYDYLDDGVADVGSLVIGILMLAASIAIVLWSFRSKQ